MKQTLLSLLLMLLPMMASADDSGTCGNHLTWTYVESTATLTIAGNGEMTDYPSRYKVPWNEYSNNMVKVVIEDGVTSISSYAFYGYSSLTSVTIPNSVAIIGCNAFEYSAWLNSQPDGLVYAGLVAYKYKGNIPSNTSVNIKEGTKSIAYGAFINCIGLVSITIPSSVISIGDWAFEGCSSLTSIIIPNNVTSIGEYVFEGCTSLESVIISNSVTFIGRNAFNGCRSLESITIPASVSAIDYGCFENCTNLSSITIPDGLTFFGSYAFDNTAWFNKQPNGMIYLGNVAYKYKGDMPPNTELSLKEGTLGIAGCAFFECYGLTSIVLPNSLVTIGAAALSSTSLKTLNVPNNVAYIGDAAFRDCSYLTSVTIPNCEMSMSDIIYDNPFGNCNAIEYVNLNCRIIGSWWFTAGTTYSSGKNLKEVVLGDQVETIEERAFSNCKQIEHITMGKSISEIKANAFTGIEKLEDVTCYAVNVPKTDRTVFSNSFIDYATLYVPASSVEAYKSTAPWSGFKQILPAKNDVPDDAEKCATPTINYKNGKLTFNCTTEGVTFVTDITDSDIKKHYDAIVSLTATYNISVYATKQGFIDSEPSTAMLCWIDATPSMEGIVNDVATVRAMPVLIQNNGSTMTITGAEEGTSINIYDTTGKLVGSAKASSMATNVNTSLRCGDIGIVKIGEKAVKVLMK